MEAGDRENMLCRGGTRGIAHPYVILHTKYSWPNHPIYYDQQKGCGLDKGQETLWMEKPYKITKFKPFRHYILI